MNHSKNEIISMNIPVEEFLNKEDIEYYRNLKDTLSSHICRNCRNKRVESFNKILITIHYYVNRKKEDDWKRSLICGVCWYKNYICVNIRQMSNLLEKCKSSINGSFKRLFLTVMQNKQQSTKILIEAIPYLKYNIDLLHMWSVRQRAQNNFQMNELMNNFVQLPKFNFQSSFVYNDHKVINKSVYQKNEIPKNEKINQSNSNIDELFNFFDDFDLIDNKFD